ncbi:MAG: TetR/AcrR family transcriptional regulator [Treponema sp.]|jgi:AcrR family transcriptional regulator|nr:TetR/AcrR family transcriptional regulator [Treponema sp.]
MAKTDIRARFTRKALRDGLVELLKAKSVLDISIKEICEAAGVSRSTFYAYYKDQYDLLGQMEEEIFVEFDKLIQQYSPGRTMLPAKELLMLIEAVLFSIAGNSNSIQALLSENGERDFQKKFARYFTGRMRQFKVIAAEAPEEERIMNYRSVFFRDGCIAMLQEWLKTGMDMSVRDMAKLFTRLIRSVLI